jgi:hypothetical protein
VSFARHALLATPLSGTVHEGNTMATLRKTTDRPSDDPAATGTERKPDEESLGDQLIREAREGHDDFVAGWSKFMTELGIQGKPIGAKKLREMLLEGGINPDDNAISRGIIAMREE